MKRALPILAGLVFSAAVAVTAARIVRNLDIPGQPHEELYGLQDFRDAFYYPSRALLDGVNPYDPVAYQAHYPVARPTSPYAPHSLLLHVPFSLLPYRAAQFAYDALNLLLILYLARACLRAVRGRAGAAAVLGLATVVLLSRPTHQTLFLGQISCIVVAGVYLALLEEERRPWLAAAGLALACMKPTYGVPLVVALLVLGRTRTAVRGVVLAGVASLPALPLLARAAGGLGALASSILGAYTIMDADHAVNAATSTIRLDAVAMIERLAGRPLPGVASMLVSLALLGAGSAAAARLARRGGNAGRVAAAGAVCLTLLVCIYHQAYDAVLLVLPATALALGGALWPRDRRATALRFTLLALLCVPAVNYLSTDTFLGRVDTGPVLRMVITSLNGFSLLAAFAIVLGIAFAPAAESVTTGAPARADRAAGAMRTALACLAFGLMALVIGMRIVHNLDVAGRPLEERYGLQDFRDNVYYASRAWLDGRNPYDFTVYRTEYPIARPLPPYTPIAFLVQAPYALLPYRLSEAVYVAVNLGLVLVLAALVARLARRPRSPAMVAGVGAILLMTRPVHQTLYIGQCALLVATGTALALLEARRRPWLGAAGLALTALKPSFAAPLALLMLARGDTRAALAGVGVAGGAILLLGIPPALAAGGPAALLDSVRAGMAVMSRDPSFNEMQSIIRIDLGGLVGRFAAGPGGATLAAIVGLAVLGPAVWACLRLRGRESDADRTLSLGIACFAILLCVYHQAYDAVLLALPAAALAAPFPAPGGTGGPPGAATAAAGWRRPILLGLLAVPAVNYLASHTLMRHIDPSRVVWLLITSANGLAIAAAFVLWIGMGVRRPPAGSAAPRGAA
jgi:glycosyl transferase family 87